MDPSPDLHQSGTSLFRFFPFVVLSENLFNDVNCPFPFSSFAGNQLKTPPVSPPPQLPPSPPLETPLVSPPPPIFSSPPLPPSPPASQGLSNVLYH